MVNLREKLMKYDWNIQSYSHVEFFVCVVFQNSVGISVQFKKAH